MSKLRFSLDGDTYEVPEELRNTALREIADAGVSEFDDGTSLADLLGQANASDEPVTGGSTDATMGDAIDDALGAVEKLPRAKPTVKRTTRTTTVEAPRDEAPDWIGALAGEDQPSSMDLMPDSRMVELDPLTITAGDRDSDGDVDTGRGGDFDMDFTKEPAGALDEGLPSDDGRLMARPTGYSPSFLGAKPDMDFTEGGHDWVGALAGEEPAPSVDDIKRRIAKYRMSVQ